MPATPNNNKARKAAAKAASVVSVVTETSAPVAFNPATLTPKQLREMAREMDKAAKAAKAERKAAKESPEAKALREQIAALTGQLRGIVGTDGRTARGESEETVKLKASIVDYLSNNPNRTLLDITLNCVGDSDSDKVKANRLVTMLKADGQIRAVGNAPHTGKGRAAILYAV